MAVKRLNINNITCNSGNKKLKYFKQKEKNSAEESDKERAGSYKFHGL